MYQDEQGRICECLGQAMIPSAHFWDRHAVKPLGEKLPTSPPAGGPRVAYALFNSMWSRLMRAAPPPEGKGSGLWDMKGELEEFTEALENTPPKSKKRQLKSIDAREGNPRAKKGSRKSRFNYKLHARQEFLTAAGKWLRLFQAPMF